MLRKSIHGYHNVVLAADSIDPAADWGWKMICTELHMNCFMIFYLPCFNKKPDAEVPPVVDFRAPEAPSEPAQETLPAEPQQATEKAVVSQPKPSSPLHLTGITEHHRPSLSLAILFLHIIIHCASYLVHPSLLCFEKSSLQTIIANLLYKPSLPDTAVPFQGGCTVRLGTES